MHRSENFTSRVALRTTPIRSPRRFPTAGRTRVEPPSRRNGLRREATATAARSYARHGGCISQKVNALRLAERTVPWSLRRHSILDHGAEDFFGIASFGHTALFMVTDPDAPVSIALQEKRVAAASRRRGLASQGSLPLQGGTGSGRRGSAKSEGPSPPRGATPGGARGGPTRAEARRTHPTTHRTREGTHGATKTGPRSPLRSTTSVSTAAIFVYTSRAGITAGGTRLVLESILIARFVWHPLQTRQTDSEYPAAMSRRCLVAPLGLGKLRACCQPWLW